ncbi:MAG: zinc ribbon domain-containing protein [Candidatus Riflebacteria bacterium]|nr:zinc ribbon domain-containing protein [Candidatus Riflebacteria bacterium]
MNRNLLMFGLVFFIGIGSQAWALFCPECGAKAADDAKFCMQCGTRFSDTPSVSSYTPVSPLVFTGSMGSPTTLIAPPSPQAFQVTSHYLNVNDYRIPKDNLFWIAEINGSRARIWCVNETPAYGFIMGWVPLSELEKRSTWKSDATIYCVEPPPPSAEIVVVHERPYWRHWNPRPFIYKWPGRYHDDRDGYHGFDSHERR